MALLKNKIGNTGIITNYHKVGNVSLNGDYLRCFVESYVSKEYRDADKPADTYAFRFNITVAEEESMGIRALCYTKIKGLNDWADAEDC
jgi:hypothetical protein